MIFVMVFWLSALLLASIYVFYPALMTWLATRGSDLPPTSGRQLSVSIVIAARDEATVIGEKIASCLAQEYPPELMQIVLVSDGSEDGTSTEAIRVGGDRVDLAEIPASGKAAALNAGLEASRGEIVVLTDARQPLDVHAVSRLVSRFDDPAVGAVSGDLRYEKVSERGLQVALHRYWEYEKRIRLGEARVHSCVGATGALYAIRRDLWTPLPLGLLLDDVYTPMQIVLRKRRVVFEPKAWAVDVASLGEHKEFGRRVRTLTGNYQLLVFLPGLLIPWRNPIWVQYLFHKVGRLASPFLLIGAFVGAAFAPGRFYGIVFLSQVAFWSLALVAYLSRTDLRFKRALALPYAFALTQGAALIAFTRFIRRDWNVWSR